MVIITPHTFIIFFKKKTITIIRSLKHFFFFSCYLEFKVLSLSVKTIVMKLSKFFKIQFYFNEYKSTNYIQIYHMCLIQCILHTIIYALTKKKKQIPRANALCLQYYY